MTSLRVTLWRHSALGCDVTPRYALTSLRVRLWRHSALRSDVTSRYAVTSLRDTLWRHSALRCHVTPRYAVTWLFTRKTPSYKTYTCQYFSTTKIFARKHSFCSVKVTNITFSECVFIALVTQHTVRMPLIYFHLWPVRLYQIFPRYHTNGTDFENTFTRYQPFKDEAQTALFKTQSVPRCKHFSSRLLNPISLCCKWHKSLFVLR